MGDLTLATPSYRLYRLATTPVTLQVILPTLEQNLPELLNTSWDKGAELLRRTINVLFRKTIIKYDSMFGFAVTMSTKWRHSNDEETGDNTVQRLKMLSSTAEQKASVEPTVIYGAWCTQRIKRNEDPA